MAVTIPAAFNLHTADHDLDARARGINGSPIMGVKTAGNLPLTTNAAQFVNNTTTSQTGTPDVAWWEFLASGGHDRS